MTYITDQHFLVDEAVIDKMISLAEIKADDTVIDIGAGKGSITKHIKAKKVIGIEKDHSLVEELRKDGIEAIEADVLRVELDADVIISNIPFEIAEAILNNFFKARFRKAVLLVPKSFAQKLLSGENIKSLIANAFFEIKKEDDVSQASLSPVPDTKLCILTLTRKANPCASDFFIRELFLQRDKKLKNALREGYVRFKNATKRQGQEFTAKLGLPEELLKKDVPQLTLDECENIISAVAQKFTD